ncbi:SUKH-4 family immunity protein [Nonomuraea wenchangensis]
MDVEQVASRPCPKLVATMEVPRDLPSRLLTAFQVVGLPWPDVRIAHFDGVLAELGERPEAQLLREHVSRLRKIQDTFFEHLGELADDHDDDPMSLVRHKDEPCVTGIREDWAETAALMPEFHAAIATFTRALLGDPPAVPDYLAAVPAWVEASPGRGIRDEPTAGRAPAADALLRWREDPYGPRICVVTGSPAAGKTRLLSWFSYSGIWDWSGYPGPAEAAICLRGMDVDDAPPAAAHGELAAVMRGWPLSAELSPPAYVSNHLAHHERLAGGPHTITPLPLRRPPTRVTRELLEDLYGPEGVVRPHDDEIHPAIAHAPTRRFLAEVGLPVDGLNQPGWTGGHRRFVEPLTESLPDSVDELRACAGLPDDLGALFMLDGLGTWHLFLDGRTGVVYEAHEELETARVAHRDVESYAYFVYVIHRERRLWCEGRDSHREAAYWCADDLALELHTYEPEAMAGDDALWPPTLEDYTLLT